ncbi:Fic family protein [Pseudomonas putida]|jgi:Fic family protein|uniref:Cell filamentation protein Fic n=1 Tax=Pseudomonas putida TaxID=303 RepID=A0A1L5PW50_PSEPU|nr:Fic family protein [Pseudomonas putida]APO84305.1 cell filamentation protein Fic [Pseudomonas putida]
MALTPFISQDKAPGDLQDAVVELLQLDAALNANIPQPLRLPMIHLLRQVNSFYSNKIEGNPMLPVDVLRAEEIQNGENITQDLLEIKCHIEAQRRLSTDPIDEVAISTRESIARMHRELYFGMPEEHICTKINGEGETALFSPGEFRTHEVRVGQHIPPPAESIGSYLNWFEGAYRLDRLHGMTPILAAAAAHHRLMWIHPFLDGNGRTGRLFTDQYLRAAGLGGYGLWTISRGFGQKVEEYYAALNAADHVRKGDLDGRGELSDGGLLKFTEYFIATALEQVRYFTSLLEPRILSQRIGYYFEMRKRGALPTTTSVELPILRIEACDVYRDLLYHGPMQRSEIQAKLGMSERSTCNLLSQMADEGLINLDGHRPLSLKLSRYSIEFLFPALF